MNLNFQRDFSTFDVCHHLVASTEITVFITACTSVWQAGLESQAGHIWPTGHSLARSVVEEPLANLMTSFIQSVLKASQEKS